MSSLLSCNASIWSNFPPHPKRFIFRDIFRCLFMLWNRIYDFITQLALMLLVCLSFFGRRENGGCRSQSYKRNFVLKNTKSVLNSFTVCYCNIDLTSISYNLNSFEFSTCLVVVLVKIILYDWLHDQRVF